MLQPICAKKKSSPVLTYSHPSLFKSVPSGWTLYSVPADCSELFYGKASPRFKLVAGRGEAGVGRDISAQGCQPACLPAPERIRFGKRGKAQPADWMNRSHRFQGCCSVDQVSQLNHAHSLFIRMTSSNASLNTGYVFPKCPDLGLKTLGSFVRTDFFFI